MWHPPPHAKGWESRRGTWSTTQGDGTDPRRAGIARALQEYFGTKDVGYAIRIKTTKLYRKPRCLKADYNLKPPQSYLYLL